MALLSLQNISIAYGGPLLLDGLNFQIEKGQRVCLLGRNGAGKSTLMKIMAGEVTADSGVLIKDQSVQVSYFSQAIPESMDGTAFEIIAHGLSTRGRLLCDYHREENRISGLGLEHSTTLDELHHTMTDHDAWSALQDIDRIATRMGIDIEWRYNLLSGGQKRRVLLARALVSAPDLLLLDEPTNHLDVDAISWMENFLLKQNITLLFVTHDRMLLRRLATRIVELDRGQLVDWSCDYDTFLERKEAVLKDEAKTWEKFDKKLAQEEVWIRKGIRARRTRDEGRVRALEQMREQRRNRRERDGDASLSLKEAQRSGKMVLEIDKLSFRYDEEWIVQEFNLRLMRGDKVGIIGPNGCGKSTLIKLIQGMLSPDSGSVRQGVNWEVLYYDQMRESLDPERSVRENVLPHGDYVDWGDERKHIFSYLQDFLFTPERAKSPVKALSGGERNRLLLARLFTQRANVLIMDEPTNDLDIETLELLEELLVSFSGTLLLICHDRSVLNNVVTSTLVFTGNGHIEEHVGGWDDWIDVKKRREETVESMAVKSDKKAVYEAEKKAKSRKKLTNKEVTELESLPSVIEQLEQEQARIHQDMSDPEFFKVGNNITLAKKRLDEIEEELMQALERWETLESIQKGA